MWGEQKKEAPRKAYEDKGRVASDEGPLDDPVAEKLRQQKCADAPCACGGDPVTSTGKAHVVGCNLHLCACTLACARQLSSPCFLQLSLLAKTGLWRTPTWRRRRSSSAAT